MPPTAIENLIMATCAAAASGYADDRQDGVPAGSDTWRSCCRPDQVPDQRGQALPLPRRAIPQVLMLPLFQNDIRPLHDYTLHNVL